MASISDTEARLADIECKYLFQQETLETLNSAVTEQWQHIDLLKKAVKKLSEQLETIEADMTSGENADSPQDPPPPHY